MGRTGRRSSTTRNCLFWLLAMIFVQAAGLINLWSAGYVEPIKPPSQPFHVLAQQLMALVLQEQGIGRQTWLDWIRNVPAFAIMPTESIDDVVRGMLEQEVLWDEQGILGIGRTGEKYGRQHFNGAAFGISVASSFQRPSRPSAAWICR